MSKDEKNKYRNEALILNKQIRNASIENTIENIIESMLTVDSMIEEEINL